MSMQDEHKDCETGTAEQAGEQAANQRALYPDDETIAWALDLDAEHVGHTASDFEVVR